MGEDGKRFRPLIPLAWSGQVAYFSWANAMKPPRAKPPLKSMKNRLRSFWQEWVRPVLFGAAVILPLKSAVADCNWVPSGSMQPTVLVGDYVLVNKLAYDLKVPFTTWHLAEWANPKRGDVVVLFSPRDGLRLVKRVVGLPGDKLEMRDERLFLNGEPVEYAPLPASVTADLAAGEKAGAVFAQEDLTGHPHAVMALPQRAALRTFGPLEVPAGQYFVMGDNRDNSNDSRYIGFVPRDQIVGQAKVVVASFDLDHWGRPRMDRLLSKLN
jgi:signal peptidase I